MSMRFPGGLIATSPVNARYPSGVWTQAQTAPYQAQNVWTRDRFWPYTTLLLQGDGATNGAQNNTFLDSSSNNFTITRNGNTTQGAFTPYEQDGYWSNYFGGSGDFIYVADSSAFTLGSGDFTVEAWVWTGVTATQKVISGQINGAGDVTSLSYQLDISSSDFPRVIVASGSTTYIATSSTTLPKNQWVHLAGVRDGSTLRIYVNGVQYGTQSVTGVTVNDSSANVSVGRHGQYAGLDWNGYISNFRLVKGTCVYPNGTTFTPSTAPLTAITNTSLLTCQSNRFKDNSTNAFAITVSGSPSVQAFQPFPGATTWSASVLGGSAYFDGTGDYLGDIGTTSSFNFLHNTTALFTFECWVYIPSTAAEQYLFDNTNGTSSQIGCSISIVAGGALSLFITRGVTGVGNVTAYVTSTGTVPTNQWVHIAVTYDQSLSSNNAKFYINGAAAGSGNKTGNTPSSSNASNTLRIGTFGAGAGAFITGYISNLRISNSIVYSSAFTPPTTPVTGGALLLNMTNAGIYDNSMMNNLETVGNAQVSTSVVKYGTGSMAFDGNGDYLYARNNQDLNLGSGDFTCECWVYITSWSNANPHLFAKWNDGGNGYAYKGRILSSGASLRFGTGNNGSLSTEFDFSGANINLNTWYHIAFTRTGSSLRAFVNGAQIGSTQTTSNSLSSNSAFLVGASSDGGLDYIYGYIDDLRITKGAARYITNFTPPIARLPAQ